MKCIGEVGSDLKFTKITQENIQNKEIFGCKITNGKLTMRKTKEKDWNTIVRKNKSNLQQMAEENMSTK